MRPAVGSRKCGASKVQDNVKRSVRDRNTVLDDCDRRCRLLSSACYLIPQGELKIVAAVGGTAAVLQIALINKARRLRGDKWSGEEQERNAEHRELYLSSLRLAAGERT